MSEDNEHCRATLLRKFTIENWNSLPILDMLGIHEKNACDFVRIVEVNSSLNHILIKHHNLTAAKKEVSMAYNTFIRPPSYSNGYLQSTKIKRKLNSAADIDNKILLKVSALMHRKAVEHCWGNGTVSSEYS